MSQWNNLIKRSGSWIANIKRLHNLFWLQLLETAIYFLSISSWQQELWDYFWAHEDNLWALGHKFSHSRATSDSSSQTDATDIGWHGQKYKTNKKYNRYNWTLQKTFKKFKTSDLLRKVNRVQLVSPPPCHLLSFKAGSGVWMLCSSSQTSLLA